MQCLFKNLDIHHLSLNNHLQQSEYSKQVLDNLKEIHVDVDVKQLMQLAQNINRWRIFAEASLNLWVL